MYNPTRWQKIKDLFRYWACRHKHTQIRVVGGGMEGEEPEILGRFLFCLDCQNNIKNLPVKATLTKRGEETL